MKLFFTIPFIQRKYVLGSFAADAHCKAKTYGRVYKLSNASQSAGWIDTHP